MKTRSKSLPYRKLFGEAELEMLTKVFNDSWAKEKDFGYQEKYERLYTDKFCELQGGGFADAVCSGSVAVYLALNTLDIEEGSEVIVSPVTDPGGVSPVILAGLQPIVADSDKNSFNIGPCQFEKAITTNTRAVILTHVGGYPVDMDPILNIAEKKKIKIIEDCSQAHGTLYKGKRVGVFGDIATFSTMFSKNHATGGCGGCVYTLDEDYYWRIRSLADRGKPFHKVDYNPKDPSDYLFPSLNYNLDELSCAVGYSTISRLQNIIDKRYNITMKIESALEKSKVVSSCEKSVVCNPSIFFITVQVDVNKLKVSKKDFADAIAAEGIWVNSDYKYVVSDWKWLSKYIKIRLFLK